MEKSNVKKDEPAVTKIRVFHQSATSLKRLNKTRYDGFSSLFKVIELPLVMAMPMLCFEFKSKIKTVFLYSYLHKRKIFEMDDGHPTATIQIFKEGKMQRSSNTQVNEDQFKRIQNIIEECEKEHLADVQYNFRDQNASNPFTPPYQHK